GQAVQVAAAQVGRVRVGPGVDRQGHAGGGAVDVVGDGGRAAAVEDDAADAAVRDQGCGIALDTAGSDGVGVAVKRVVLVIDHQGVAAGAGGDGDGALEVVQELAGRRHHEGVVAAAGEDGQRHAGGSAVDGVGVVAAAALEGQGAGAGEGDGGGA